MRTAEYYNILAEDFKLKVESLETTTSWGTTYYDFVVYDEFDVEEQIKGKKKEEKQYEEEGIAPFLSLDGVFCSDDFNEAIEKLFQYKVDNNEI